VHSEDTARTALGSAAEPDRPPLSLWSLPS